MPELLFEAGMEEIPARMIAAAETELTGRIVELLRRERLLAPDHENAHEVHSYSTPRRIAVQVSGVLARQPDATQPMTGPAWSVAFKDGQPTPAAQAFARKAGVDVSALEKTTTPKGDYVTATVTHRGRPAAEVLGGLLAAELAALYWPKNMYWRALKPERFVRPIRWIVAMLDQAVLPVEFGGIRAGNQTFGHRILHGGAPVAIDHPEDYLGALEAAQVTADVSLRRHRIRKALDLETRDISGARWREDAALVETVTHLTEWPAVVVGSFDREFLALPEEVLVTVMRDHQKYFAVENAQGKLEPYFLAVLNTHPEESGIETIRHGNERVLRARFNDARFFWTVDQKATLEDRVEMLKSVTFHKELGTYWDKTELNQLVSRSIAQSLRGRGQPINEMALDTAVRLAKVDLTTELVKEFTELQGIIGGLYARAQGFGEVIALPIYWQYQPASMEDSIPPTIEGQLLGLSDRLATIFQMFSIGAAPSGSKDPYALRRAGNAIIKILAEASLPLKLSELLPLVGMLSVKEGFADTAAVGKFLEERLEFYLRETRGFAHDVVRAVLSAKSADKWAEAMKDAFGLIIANDYFDGEVADAVDRVEAVASTRGSEDFAAVCSAFKRMKNILIQAAKKGENIPREVITGRLVEPAEDQLDKRSALVRESVEQYRATHQYRQALEQIATLRPHVDLFFDKVMVMVDDEAIRRNRLALIAQVLGGFSSIADFSELVSA